MHYMDTAENAGKYALSALKKMKALEIAANPRNFALWYEYFAGKNDQLNKTLDDLVAVSSEIDDEAYNSIYERFILAGATAMRDQRWSDRIEAVATSILAALTSTGDGAEQYGAALENFSGGLTKAKDIEQIRGLVTNIVKETKTMDLQARELQHRLSESATEIDELRKALKNSQRDALTDALTGVANRKCFDQTLFDAVTEAVEEGEPLSLILADIDHFKAFNDKHGHQVGDQVLRLVGRTLVQCIKGSDTAARFGGEEFAIILPATTGGGATAVAENIRKTVANKRLVRKGSENEIGALTISLGVSTYVTGEDLTDFIERVDQALYKAKSLGRNRVICEDRRAPVAAE